jgi:RimJ/RimL family protein N-acetyltransferase
MKLIRYGVSLQRLQKTDIELVRQWRNSDLIRETMEYRDEITPEMQLKWFESINNNRNFYMLIEYEGKKIGLVNGKNIDWEAQELESGIFFWETKYYETFVPAIVSIMITDMCIRLFGWDKMVAHILKTNQRAIQYNLSLGYILSPDQEHIENQAYILTPESFQKSTGKLQKALAKLYPGHEHSIFVLEPHDFENGMAQQVQPLIDQVKIPVQKEWFNGAEFFYF